MTELQSWVEKLPLRQQSVVMLALRGPDGLRKEHPAKELLRWYRRCTLVWATRAVETNTKTTFYDDMHAIEAEPNYIAALSGGESFMGPLRLGRTLRGVVEDYIDVTDEMPHHFQLHLLHAIEILGYKHPLPKIRYWWNRLYVDLVEDMHLHTETEEEMDERLP